MGPHCLHLYPDQDTASDNDEHAEDESEQAQGHSMTLRRAVTMAV
jgi:hypothetical protein